MITPVLLSNFSDCAKMVACGEEHTLVLSLSGLVYACGGNSQGQCGNGTRENQLALGIVEQISTLPMHFIAASNFSASISEES